MSSSVKIIIPNKWKNKIHVPNHQPVHNLVNGLVGFYRKGLYTNKPAGPHRDATTATQAKPQWARVGVHVRPGKNPAPRSDGRSPDR